MRKSLKGLVMHEGRYRLSVAHLLVAIFAMFVVLPFADYTAYGPWIEAVAFTVVMLCAINAVGGRRNMLFAAAGLAFPAILLRWVYHIFPFGVSKDLYLLAGIAFVSFVIYQLLRFVVIAPQVNSEVLCAAVAVYALMAVAWSFVFTILNHWQPGALKFTNPHDAEATLQGFIAIYFSVQVLTTITFGDILPVSNVARMLALVESAMGVFYMAILMARLVGVYTSTSTNTSSS